VLPEDAGSCRPDHPGDPAHDEYLAVAKAASLVEHRHGLPDPLDAAESETSAAACARSSAVAAR